MKMSIGMLHNIIRLIFSIVFLAVIPCYMHASENPHKASPDQVLVLFNMDYTIDVDGSEPGQDSKEVAEYYQKMHTDSETGKKPYLLGLKCNHGKKHLNNWYIKEDSNDNESGIEYYGSGKGPRKLDWVRDSRRVEINIMPGKDKIDWDSVELLVQSSTGQNQKITDYVVSGIPVKKGRSYAYPEIEQEKGRCYRFNAQKIFRGTVKVITTIKNVTGETIKNDALTYWDIREFKSSIKGKDGILDETHFQEDIAIPVKAFLENADNKLSDGTLLKDHILYIVVSHGLPFSCKSVFGVQRGVTSRINDFGVLGSLEQRLQTLYYGWGTTIIPPLVSRYIHGGPERGKGVRNYLIMNALSYPLTGRRWNPYMHPDTYSFLARTKKSPDFIKFEPLEQERKNKHPSFFAYGVSRIDGQGPREAKRLIDYSLYASKYLRPEMTGRLMSVSMKPALQSSVRNNLWGREELEALNFPVISKHSREGMPFLKRQVLGNQKDVDDEKLNYSGYFPGGMDRTVVSSNGWNMGRSAAIWKQIDHGVTVSACGGPAYGDGPHITNATFWDNRILMRYLFRGHDLGECFLRSTLYVNWATSLIGDPLYHPDIGLTVIDEETPEVGNKKDISIDLFQTAGKYAAVLEVSVKSTKANPEVCLLKVDYFKNGDTKIRTSEWPIFSVRPNVIIRDLEPDTTYLCRPVLTDPYGNSTDLSEQYGLIRFKTGSFYQNLKTKKAQIRKNQWEFDTLGMPNVCENGTVEIEFKAGINGLIPSIESKGIKLYASKYSEKNITISYEIGGFKKKEMIISPLKKGEKATLIVRWKKYPVTREILLKSKSGIEFTIAADVRTPWVKIKPDLTIIVKQRGDVQIFSGRIFNDASPGSEEAYRLEIKNVDKLAWDDANT